MSRILAIVILLLAAGGVWIATTMQEQADEARLAAQESAAEAREDLEDTWPATQPPRNELESGAFRRDGIEEALVALYDEVAALRLAVNELRAESPRSASPGQAPSESTATKELSYVAEQLERLLEVLRLEPHSGLGARTLDDTFPSRPEWRDFEHIRPGMSLRDVLSLVGYPKDTLVYQNGSLRWNYDQPHPEGAPRTCVLSMDGVVLRVTPLVD